MDTNGSKPIRVTPEAIAACAQFSTSLGEAIKGAAAVGDKELVKELSQELVRVGKSLTWLLREDRDKFAVAKKGA